MNNQISECFPIPKQDWLKTLQHFKVWCSIDNKMYIVFTNQMREDGYEISVWLIKQQTIFEPNSYFVEDGTNSIILRFNHTRYIVDELKTNELKTFGTLRLTDLDNYKEMNPVIWLHGVSTPATPLYKGG